MSTKLPQKFKVQIWNLEFRLKKWWPSCIVMQTKVDLIREGQILHLSEETPVLYWMHTKLSETGLSLWKLSFRSLQVLFESLQKSTAPNPFIELFDSRWFKQIYQENGIDWHLELTLLQWFEAQTRSLAQIFSFENRGLSENKLWILV